MFNNICTVIGITIKVKSYLLICNYTDFLQATIFEILSKVNLKKNGHFRNKMPRIYSKLLIYYKFKGQHIKNKLILTFIKDLAFASSAGYGTNNSYLVIHFHRNGLSFE